MKFFPENIYHIYNRGNNKQQIFFIEENYSFFLQKIKKEIIPICDILAYCLMPNHFHMMVYLPSPPTRQTAQSGQTGRWEKKANMHPLSRKIGTLLSSYTQAINKQENRTGSLFQQKTKAIELSNEDEIYPYICFNFRILSYLE